MSNNINRFRSARNTIVRLVEDEFGKQAIKSEVVTVDGTMVKLELPIGMEVTVSVVESSIMITPKNLQSRLFVDCSIRSAFRQSIASYNDMMFARSAKDIMISVIDFNRKHTYPVELNLDARGDVVVELFGDGVKMFAKVPTIDGLVKVDEVVRVYQELEKNLTSFCMSSFMRKELRESVSALPYRGDHEFEIMIKKNYGGNA